MSKHLWTTTDISLYDYIPRWGFPNLFSGVDKTLNKVGSITSLNLRKEKNYTKVNYLSIGILTKLILMVNLPFLVMFCMHCYM